MRRLIALLLCICLIGSLVVYATEDTTELTAPEKLEEPAVPETLEEPIVPETTAPVAIAEIITMQPR